MDDLQDILEFQEIEELYEEGIINNLERPLRMRKRCDNFNRWRDDEFYNRFRLSKQTVLNILPLIDDQIAHRTERNNALSPLQQLLICLRFYASGSFQILMGDFADVHRTTANQIIKRVTPAIARLRPQFIYMPTNDEIPAVQQAFYHLAKFPRVVGAIDCTHIRIQSPGGENAETFRDRKGFFSYNVQVISDANHKIRDIVCCYPGSTHDSHIFNNSRVRMRFENQEMGTGVLLGDSAYPCRSYLMTPIATPTTPSEHRFNNSQIKTRTIVERTFGIYKRRFPTLSLGIRNKYPLALDIIVATAVLHNIAISHNEPDFPNDEEPQEEEEVLIENNMEHGNQARRPFLQYFETVRL